MSDTDFRRYLDYFIPDYAVEISANYGLSGPAALEQAKQEIAAALPDDANTQGQVLLCLIEHCGATEHLIGYLWYKPDTATHSAFIYDFYVLAAHRGRGLGKQALQVLEGDLKGKGFERIKLRVAADNGRARHVYETTGFRVTGVNMSKEIASS